MASAADNYSKAVQSISIDTQDLYKLPNGKSKDDDVWLTVDQFTDDKEENKVSHSKYFLAGTYAPRASARKIIEDVDPKTYYTFKLFLGEPDTTGTRVLDSSTFNPLLCHTFTVNPKCEFDLNTLASKSLGRESLTIEKMFQYKVDCSGLSFPDEIQEISIGIRNATKGMAFDNCIKQKGKGQRIKERVAGKAEDGLLELSLKVGRTIVARGVLNPYEHLSASVRTTALNTHVFEYVPVHEPSTVSKRVSDLPQLPTVKVDDEKGEDVQSQRKQAAEPLSPAKQKELPWYSTILDMLSFNSDDLRQIN